METSTRGAVIVGVTGPGQETAALRFAAECATRDGVEVVLAHAYRATLPHPPPSVIMTYAEAADIAAELVKGVEEEFAALTGDRSASAPWSSMDGPRRCWSISARTPDSSWCSTVT